MLTPLAGWGRCPVVAGHLVRSEDFARATASAALSRGLGRAYGDAALPAGGGEVVAESVLADRLLGFDSATGILRAEAGLSLAELNAWSVPRGWFTPVTPGTQFVTLGGMVAADVHGKNHHRAGCFGEHVHRLLLRVADGQLVWCSDSSEPDLFRATLGGMGLTGHILEVEFRMAAIPSPWIRTESERLPHLGAMIDGLLESGARWDFTVGWLDGMARGRALGRGILMKGRWAEPGEAPAGAPRRTRPVPAPAGLLAPLVRPWSVGAFNRAYYRKHLPRVRRGFTGPERFFYPLDAIGGWNRLYGPRGFIQYQFLVPHGPEHGPVRRVLERVQELGSTPFLAVVKELGPEGKGMISFPGPGVTVALDLPFGPGSAAVVAGLNALVASLGGRVYLAKDALSSAEDFRRMEPRLAAWQAVRHRWDPRGRLRSALSARLLDGAP